MGLMYMMSQKRLLIVDDEPSIVHMLDEFFQMEGCATACACNAAEALEAISRLSIDLVLLDVNMPGMDGFELCRRIREHLSCPIIFLTARVEDVDQIDGFAAGADDYVLKPFSLEVLGGRVRAHLAREARRDARDDARPKSVRMFSNITIDYAERTVEVAAREDIARKADAHEGNAREGDVCEADAHEGNARKGSGPDHSATSGATVRLDLTHTEFDIIALLSKSPGRVYDRVNMYELVWGWDATGDPAIVREHVRRIRKKFAEAGAGEDVIETVWGVGYRWAAR